MENPLRKTWHVSIRLFYVIVAVVIIGTVAGVAIGTHIASSPTAHNDVKDKDKDKDKYKATAVAETVQLCGYYRGFAINLAAPGSARLSDGECEEAVYAIKSIYQYGDATGTSDHADNIIGYECRAYGDAKAATYGYRAICNRGLLKATLLYNE